MPDVDAGLSDLSLDEGLNIVALESYDDAALDELPFGVICLDDQGTILKYNLAEARLARLDRGRVLGKNFFRKIAPCTATADFEGRFRSFLVGREQHVSFPYIFDFKFGAQEVNVELFRATRSRCFFVCINRHKFRPPRAGFEAVQAPRQAELVPGEDKLGVRRDAAEQRVVLLPETALRALRLTWDQIAPQGWALFAAEWGFRWGRLAVIDLETEVQEQRDRSLRDLPLEEAIALISTHIENDGWGRLGIDVTSSSATTRGAAIITIDRSALGEACGPSNVPRCQLIGGVVRAMLSHVSQRQLVLREVRCVAQGAHRCEMVAVAYTRRSQLEHASAAANDLPGVLEKLDEPSASQTSAGEVLARLF